jgi:D-alanyl-D-alanine carboxypeptidase
VRKSSHTTVNSGDGDDFNRAFDGDDEINSGDGDDENIGDFGDDTISSGDGDDTNLGDGDVVEGNDFIKSGKGNDINDGGERNITSQLGLRKRTEKISIRCMKGFRNL